MGLKNMDHNQHNMQNIRMPGASKKTNTQQSASRKRSHNKSFIDDDDMLQPLDSSTAALREHAKYTPEGRGTRTEPTDEMFDQAGPSTSAQLPGMSAPYNVPTSKRGRRTRASALEEASLSSNPSPSYREPPPAHSNPNTYTIPDRNIWPQTPQSFNPSDILHSSPRYADQARAPDAMPEGAAYWCDAPSAVHNLPLGVAPAMHHVRAARPPVTAQGTQQMSSPAPVACPARTRTADLSVQTHLELTEKDIKFIRMLRSKKADMKKVIQQIESNEYISVIPQTPAVANELDDKKDVPVNTINELVPIGEAKKNELLNRYIMMQTVGNSVLPFVNANLAIQGNFEQQTPENESSEALQPQLRNVLLQGVQQHQQSDQNESEEGTAPEMMSANTGLPTTHMPTPPTHPQMAPNITSTPPDQTGQTIPTILTETQYNMFDVRNQNGSANRNHTSNTYQNWPDNNYNNYQNNQYFYNNAQAPNQQYSRAHMYNNGYQTFNGARAPWSGPHARPPAAPHMNMNFYQAYWMDTWFRSQRSQPVNRSQPFGPFPGTKRQF